MSAQGRDTEGRYATVLTEPEQGLELSPTPDGIEGLRATLEDFLTGALPGFGFTVPDGNVEVGVDRLIDYLIDCCTD